MDLTLAIIWISFVFCLALTVGGIMLLFRFKKLSALTGYKYLQYSIILLYTFGFYSLWSQVLIARLPNLIEIENLDSIQSLIFLMGTPFLLIGLIMMLAWSYHTQKRSSLTRPLTFGVPTLLLAVAYFIYLNYFGANDSVAAYSLVGIAFTFSSVLLFVTHQSDVLQGKWKLYLIVVFILSGAVYSANFLSIYNSEYFSPVFILLFFLTNTVIEGIYMYTARVDESQSLKSFDDFVSKYQITNREADIIREIYNGKSNQEIADSLFVSLQTVKDHSSRIYQKTQVKSRSQVIALLRDYL